MAWRTASGAVPPVCRRNATDPSGVSSPNTSASIRLEKASIDRSGQPNSVVTHGRHDPCVGIRATPIAEAMLALVLMDAALQQRAQGGDVELPIAPVPARRG